MRRQKNERTTRQLFLSLFVSAAMVMAVPLFAENPTVEEDQKDEQKAEQTMDEWQRDTEEGAESVKDQTKDAAITAKVKSKLVADSEINPFDIDVDTTDGVVRLSGTVAEDQDRQVAERIATETSGVMEVENELVVAAEEQIASTEASSEFQTEPRTDLESERALDQDEELPRTASPLPLIFLLGLGGLGAAAGLRRQRK